MDPPVTMPSTAPSPGRPAWVRGPWSVARAAVVAPFAQRQGRALLFCLAGLAFVLVSPAALFLIAVDLTWFAAGADGGNPSPAEIGIACVGLAILLVLLVSTPAARRIGALQRTLANRLLGIQVAAPPPPAALAGPPRRDRVAGDGLPVGQVAGRPG